MVFSDEFVGRLQEDPIQGALELREVYDAAMSVASTSPSGFNNGEHEIAQEAYALLVELIDAKVLDISPIAYELNGNRAQDCQNVTGTMDALKSHYMALLKHKQLELHRKRFRTSIHSAFAYEFSQGDLERIQVLINDLRRLISSTAGFELDHQRRLLKRLEQLQQEIHKRVSDLDRFWGLIGDAGVVLGKLGANAKPIVDRIREITQIIWQTQSRTEELPSGTALPQLGNGNASE
ncbi:MAG: hypothetical protein V4505_19580 [Pseudomonadota bacterium]